ncbi:MAG: hypothetical protein DRN27_09005 [Thermoplasmata archaeon]|nr:MAG: hypothetical protein DRQ57_00340 [Gammaproteobacteria bacterium]RLF56800.1 MAG: hypothetical protein DRN27_09005 [Thermoplasmata archaeon]
MRDRIKDIVFQALKELNAELEINIFDELSENTAIYENLESINLLDLIVEIEDLLQKEFGKYIQIADENSMNVEQTIFKTIASTIDGILEKVS